MKNNIALIGFKSCGKSTIAKLYADRFDYNYCDSDELLIKKFKCKNIAEVYKLLGEFKFRQAEAEVIKDIINSISPNDCNIIATGGGVVLDAQNIVNLRQKSKIVFINTSRDIIIERLLNNKQTALFGDINTADIIQEHEHRLSKYVSASDYILEIDDKNSEQIVEELAAVVNAKVVSE